MKRILYTGLEAKTELDCTIIHCPLIKVLPYSFHSKKAQIVKATWSSCRSLIFTSKSAVSIFFTWMNYYKLQLDAIEQVFIVGCATASFFGNYSNLQVHIAKNETGEGMIESLKSRTILETLIYPHSNRSRPLIKKYLQDRKLHFIDWPLYKTEFSSPTFDIDFSTIDEIFFTSPSTVDSFYHFFKFLPTNCTYRTQGEITAAHLYKLQEKVRGSR